MKVLRTIAIALAAAVIGALVTLAIVRGGAKDADDEGAAKGEKPAQRVSNVNGETVVTIDAATASQNNIQTTPVAAAQRSSATSSYATAVDVKDLVDARNQLGVARAQEAQSRARLAAADAELARVKVLHADNRNVSDRVLQEAEASVNAERAGLEAAQAASRAASGGIEQRWGSAIVPFIDDLISNRRVLVQVVSDAQPPQRITVSTGQTSVPATYVSPAVRSDPHIQGRSWFYVAPGGSIVPGMALDANVTQGATQQGVIVPRDAIVWSAGRSWVYAERAPNQFARLAVDASVPMGDGYFVSTITPGQKVVTSGAQQLLSEEAKPKVED